MIKEGLYELEDRHVETMEIRYIIDSGISLDGVAAVVGRGGGLLAMEGGVYAINAVLFDHAVRGANGVQHPAQLGPQLAKKFSDEIGCPAFVVNPPDTDEIQDIARVTGIKGVYRNVHLHALNLKETAIRHADSMGKNYEECNFVVCHIGGGISISAHRKGRMIDGNDIVGGEGPMAPTRCGAIPATELVEKITEACSFIAPVTAYPGEFEMETMAAGAIRALAGREQVKAYTGTPSWDRANFEQ